MHVNIRNAFLVAAAAVLATTPVAAQAYLGPGLGMGAISVVFGIIGSIFLAIVGVVWYPFKRLLRKMRRAKQANHAEQDLASK